MLDRQEAYDELIRGTKTPTISARTSRGSKALASLRLRERSHQTNQNTIDDFEEEHLDENFTWEREGAALLPNHFDEELPVQDTELEDVLARLDELCREEHGSFLDADEDSSWDRYREITAELHADELRVDTTILERIKAGNGPHDRIFKDLLAPLRSEPLAPEAEESEADILRVLLAWNKRIADSYNADLADRQAFIAALVERIEAVDKVMAIVSDDTNSNQNDETGQNGILEPSRRRLLRAIHAYRPETRDFKNQNPFDMLVIILAHVRQHEFEVANKDDCVYLIFKALNGQEQLKNRFNREKQRRSYQSQKEEAEQDDNQDEVRRCRTKWRVSNKRLAERTRQKLMTRIQHARNGLRKAGIDELLKLAVLRSAQPRAEREDDPDGYSPPWEDILAKCTQADDYSALRDKLGEHFLNLEAVLEATADKARDMKTTHNLVLSWTVKLAGADLKDRDEVERERIMTARLSDPVTARIMEETLEGMLNTHLVATQMLVHLELMEESMSELLAAATTKHDDLTGLACSINRNQELSATSGTEGEDVSAERSEDDED
ncbi:hypothetical protein ACET3X_001380 [Alternaria dauci]|uniref:Uncharacterized protein n=1 Tax=Alternaria dauci TaxID=48095 RepID=A0ABR3UX60_9PLEO